MVRTLGILIGVLGIGAGVGCGGGPGVGTEGGACYGNRTCNDDLVCLSDLCVHLPLDAGPDPDATVDASLLADAMPFECTTSLEPNDDVGTAVETAIAAGGGTVGYDDLSICPDTDRDLFHFGIATNGMNMKATVTVDLPSGQLVLRVLNSTGAAIANGVNNGTTEMVVTVNNFAQSNYYVSVEAPAFVQNNYSIVITTCDGAPCP